MCNRLRFFACFSLTALLILSPMTSLCAQEKAQDNPKSEPKSDQKKDQKPEQKPDEQKPAEIKPEVKNIQPDEIVRISTQLVQVDATVTDKKGEHVLDLTPDDFELFVDGKKQALTYFSLIKLPEPASVEKPNKEDFKKSPLRNMPTKNVESDKVKRTVAFIIDDLGMSFASMNYTRSAVKKFLDEQMQDGDLVGIIRTGRGLGMLEQFTSDKRILYKAVEKLTWNPFSRNMIPQFGKDPTEMPSDQNQNSNNNDNEDNAGSITSKDRFDDFRDSVMSRGTLSTMGFIVNGLRELPGRKAAILISDGLKLWDKERSNSLIVDQLRTLTDRANRSGVVIYSLDSKGLLTLTPGADANMGEMTQTQMIEQQSKAARDNFESQDGLQYLANETGGIAVFNNNDINFGIKKALKDMQSYYLIGFDPDDDKFDKKYHSMKVKVLRKGLQVRSRSGFIGQITPRIIERTPTANLDAKAVRDRQIISALYSPFGTRDLSMQMTSFFFNTPKDGAIVKSIFHIDPRNITFKDNPEKPGEKILRLEIVAFTLNEEGRILEQHGRAVTMPLTEEGYKFAVKRGFLYSADFMIKKPGAYQFRSVLRDPETGKMGSASQFIQVPDLKKKRLAVSGLVLGSMDNRKNQPPPTEPIADTKPSDVTDTVDAVNPSPATRRFSQSGVIDYATAIYNPTLDKQTGKSNLITQAEIYYDGKRIYQTQERPADEIDSPTGKNWFAQGSLQLNKFPKGDFMMRIIVKDSLAKQKYSVVDSWMDFNVR